MRRAQKRLGVVDDAINVVIAGVYFLAYPTLYEGFYPLLKFGIVRKKDRFIYA